RRRRPDCSPAAASAFSLQVRPRLGCVTSLALSARPVIPLRGKSVPIWLSTKPMAGQKLRRKRSAGPIVAIVIGIWGAALVAFPLLIATLGMVLGLVGVVLSLAVTVGPWLALGYLGYRLARRSPPRPQPVWTAPAWNPPPPVSVAPPPAQPEADPAA